MPDIFILEEEQKKAKQQVASVSLSQRINNYLLSNQKLKTRDKTVFFRLLSTMINAGITLSKWVAILEKQEKKQTILKTILQRFWKELKEWKWLSECLELFPSSFSRAEIGMIESWEKTWKLNTSLRDLADQVEKIDSINGKLKSAMIYPAMIIIVVTLVIALLMIMVIPKLLEIFDGTAQLPWPTLLLMNISDFMVQYWWMMFAAIMAFVIWVSFWGKTLSWRYYLDNILLSVPVIGNIVQKIVLSKFSRVLSGMLKSWVSIIESLRITSDAVWNEVYRQRVLFLRDDVQKWLKIFESLEDDPLFPEMMVSMIQIWEQTAKVDEIILKIADFYDEEVDNTIWVINKILEPIIIVVLAVVVWFIAMAIMLPIMELTDAVTGD